MTESSPGSADFILWPVSEEAISENEVLLGKARTSVGKLEESLFKVKAFLLILEREAPLIRQVLATGKTDGETKCLTSIVAVHELRSEVIKFNQQAAECLNFTTHYLQNREKFILIRRDWLAAHPQ